MLRFDLGSGLLLHLIKESFLKNTNENNDEYMSIHRTRETFFDLKMTDI